ncbi:Tn3 family transposase [Streptomyces sp. NPDC001809]
MGDFLACQREDIGQSAFLQAGPDRGADAVARTRTASTEAIRRFTRNASHPTYAAMLEVGRAQKALLVARYLRLRDLQREIEEGLNVMESSNGANSMIAHGKGGEIASNRRDEQEMFVLCLRILPSALVYVNA